MDVYKASLGYFHWESTFLEKEARIDVGSYVGFSVGECSGKCDVSNE